jgi:hypothetical protein
MWERHHPFRWRTWIRAHLPWFLIDLGVSGKGRDCEAVGGWSEIDNATASSTSVLSTRGQSVDFLIPLIRLIRVFPRLV